MTIRYVLDNYINSDTLEGVSSEQTPFYGKEHMYNKDQGHPWRMTGKTSQWAKWNLGSDRPTALCLMNHNLKSGATIKIQAHATDAWGAPTYDEVVTWHTRSIWMAISADLPWWRLTIEDAGNDNLPQIGEIILYTSGTFTMNFWWPYGYGTKYITGENITDYGMRRRRKKAKQKIFSLPFDGVTDTNLLGEVENFFDALDGVNPFVLIPDSTIDESWYGFCLNNFEARQAFIDQNSFILNFEEQSRGATLL